MTNDLRTCATCACHAYVDRSTGTLHQHKPALAAPQDLSMVCRRNGPIGQVGERQVPVMDRTGQPVVINGRPRLERKQIMMLGHSPTAETAVCYDGWRALGTLPGEGGEDDFEDEPDPDTRQGLKLVRAVTHD